MVNIFRYLLREYHRNYNENRSKNTKFGGFKFELVYRPVNPVNRRFSVIYRYRCGPVNGLPPVIFSLAGTGRGGIEWRGEKNFLVLVESFSITQFFQSARCCQTFSPYLWANMKCFVRRWVD